MTDSHKELRWIRILLTIIAVPVLVVIFRTLKSIFIPLVFAVFLSFVFSPLNRFLREKKIPPPIVMAIMIVIILLLMAASTLLISMAANSLVTGFPRYQASFNLRIEGWISSLNNILARYDVDMSINPLQDISQLIKLSSNTITKTITGVMSTTVDISWNFFLIIVFLLFIVAQDGNLSTRLNKVLNENQQKRTASTLGNIQGQIRKYLLTKTVISFCTACVGMVLMLIFGVDFVLVCGILLFILNFIPNIGSTIASGIPILISFLQSGLDFRTIAFGVLIVATQMLFGNVVEPKIQGQRMNLSPIMVLVSLIFWGWVWGIVGMILAVPITSAINIMLIELDEKNLISAIISSDPGLPKRTKT